MSKVKKKNPIKKKTGWSAQKWPGLNLNYQVATRREFLDFDYIKKLSDKEKEWLNEFIMAYYVTNFKDEIIKLTKEEKRKLYGNNNSRNRDIFAIFKATGKLLYWGPNQILGDSDSEPYEPEED